MIVDVYIGSTKLDLYKDDSINLSSSVLDIQDITKNTTDFTKAFTVPASSVNNKLFKHYYNANIENTFDARVKVSGRIELGGLPFKTGKFVLNTVSVKKGKPSSYNINFTGDLVKLTDLFGKDELKDLDLSEFDHTYSYANVLQGLKTSLFTDKNIIYSTFYKRQLYYNGDPIDETNEEKLVNIAYHNSSQSNGIKWDELNPSIRLIKIIEAIETKYGLTFTRQFFDSVNFSNAYMWLNNTEETESSNAIATVNFDSGDNTYMDFSTNVGTYNTIGEFLIYWRLYLSVFPASGYEDIQYKVIMYDGDTVIKEESNLQGDTVTIERIRDEQNTGDRDYLIRYEVVADQDFQYTCTLQQRRYEYPFAEQNYFTYGSSQSIERSMIISKVIPKMKVLDFMKGLFNAFKLVVIPENENTFYINDLNSYYAEGDLIDLTKYIDFDKTTVSRGKVLNEINLTFQEPETLLNNQFEINTGSAYGDEEVLIKDSNGDLLDGESLDLELPFEQITYERLTDQETNLKTNFLYGGVFDREINAVNPKAHIHYNVNRSVGSSFPISILDATGTANEINGYINMPNHSNANSEGNAFLFSREVNEFDGNVMGNNLYTNYHQKYVENLFNIKRRDFDFNSKNIPLSILTKLSLNDLIVIKDNNYRVNKYDLNLVTGEAKYQLFNVFESDVKRINTTDLYLFFDSNTSTQSINVSNLNEQGYTATKQDAGFGTDWLTITSSGDILTLTLDPNDTVERVMSVLIESNSNSSNFTLAVEQESGGITFDTTLLTWDSTQITFDNE